MITDLLNLTTMSREINRANGHIVQAKSTESIVIANLRREKARRVEDHREARKAINMFASRIKGQQERNKLFGKA